MANCRRINCTHSFIFNVDAMNMMIISEISFVYDFMKLVFIYLNMRNTCVSSRNLSSIIVCDHLQKGTVLVFCHVSHSITVE